MTEQEIEFVTPYIEYILKIGRRGDTSHLTDSIDIKVCEIADMKIDISDTVAIENIKEEINKFSDIHKFGLLIRMLFSNTNNNLDCNEPYRTIIRSFLLGDMRNIIDLYVKSLNNYLLYHNKIEKAYYAKLAA
jgi:hypothetical protein